MKVFPVALTAAAVSSLLLLGAAPAYAAGNQIDPGDSLYALNCDDNVYNDWQLLGVEPTTAFSTLIGDGTGGVDDNLNACAGQAAYNPVTGVSYYLQWTYDEEAGDPHDSLATIDVVTGDSVTIGEFFEEVLEVTEYPSIDAIAIGTDGSGYALGDGYLYSLNLATAELTQIGGSLCCTYAFAADPTSGILYGIDYSNELFSVDPATGDYTSIGDVEVGDGYTGIYSLQIDGGGQFWIEVDTPSPNYYATLWSFTLPTYATPVYSGIFDDDPYYTESLLLIPGVALPATGADAGALPIAAGVLALGALMLGVAFVARRRAA